MRQCIEQVGLRPSNCQVVKLRDICATIDYGYTASSNNKAAGPRFLRITDIQAGLVDWPTVPGCEIPSDIESKYRLADGDIVFARTGGTTGKSYLLTSPPRAVFASYLIRLRAARHVLPKYLYYYFQSDDYWSQIRAHARGAAQPNVNASLLGSLAVPLLPLNEQRHVVASLDDQLAAVDRARAAAETQREAARGLTSSIIRQTFAGPATMNWRTVQVHQVAKIQTGFAFKSETFSSEGVRCLRNANVVPGKINWEDVVRVPEELAAKVPAFAVRAGDIILSLDRPFISTGLKVARVQERDTPSLLVQRVARFFLEGEVNPAFFYSYLNSDGFMDAILGHDQSLTVPHVSPKQVGAAQIPLPSLRIQEETVSRLRNQIDQIERLSESLAAQERDLGAFPATLLRQAFGGDL